MDLRITRAAHAQLLAEAAASPNREVCGLLLGREGLIEKATPCTNTSHTPRVAFELDPAALIAAHKSERAGGAAILGCYHSHPNGRAELSATDRAQAQRNGWVWAVIAQGDVTFWQAIGDMPVLKVPLQG